MSTTQPWTYDDAARMAHTLGQRGPLSAAKREERMGYYIAAVDGMATVLRDTSRQAHALTRVTDAQLTREREYNALTGAHGSRLDALEGEAADRASSFRVRLRWLLTGR